MAFGGAGARLSPGAAAGRSAPGGAIRRLAGQAVQVGDPAFDHAFAVRSSDPHVARAVLTPSVRAALLQARARAPEIFIEAGAVRFVREGIPAPESIDALFETVAGVARTFGT